MKGLQTVGLATMLLASQPVGAGDISLGSHEQWESASLYEKLKMLQAVVHPDLVYNPMDYDVVALANLAMQKNECMELANLAMQKTGCMEVLLDEITALRYVKINSEILDGLNKHNYVDWRTFEVKVYDANKNGSPDMEDTLTIDDMTHHIHAMDSGLNGMESSRSDNFLLYDDREQRYTIYFTIDLAPGKQQIHKQAAQETYKALVKQLLLSVQEQK